MRKFKIITLTLTVVILIVGFGIYRMENKMKTENNLENLESMETIKMQEENIEPVQSYTQFSDNLVLIRGGSFNMDRETETKLNIR